MTEARLILYTKIAFILVPILILISLLWNPSNVYHKIDLNSFLAFGFEQYASLVCLFHLIHVYREWRDRAETWKKSMGKAFGYIFLLALAILIIILSGRNEFNYFIGGSMILFPFSFLFINALVALVIGFIAIKYRRNRPKLIFGVLFPFGIIFTLIGIIPALMIFIFFFMGPEAFMAPCYCPVNRKGRPADFLFKPLYKFRKDRLKKRLCLAKKST